MSGIAVGIAAILIVLIAIKIFSLPLRLILKLFVNTASGYVALIVINMFSGFTGIYLGLNLVNALIIGLLGLPGLGFLLVARWLLLI